jgi:predicted NBD/HSP70 family sugar kinase
MVRTGITAKRILRAPQLRGANRAALLSLLQQNEAMSRADISRQSGLSEGAVSRIITALMKDGLVREDGAENSTGGRPGRRLKLAPKRVVFGAEIENWETRCSVCTMLGRVVETRRFRTPASAEETLERVAEMFHLFRKELGSDRLPGAGICARGIVNSEIGTLVLGNRPEWKHVPIRKFLEARIREPVFVENNVRAAALAEYTYGAAEMLGRRCFVFVKVDEGVGMSVLFDGKLYHGPHMAAGEFGQMVVQSSNSNERHDRPGCLERLIANPVICNRYAELSGSRRQAGGGDTAARVRRIAQWAASGDTAARQVVEETARYLAVGISNVVWGLDADAIVIDGPITEAWRIIEPLLRQQLPDDSDLWGSRNLLVRPSAFSGEAALIGAAALPLASIFARGASASSSVRASR